MQHRAPRTRPQLLRARPHLPRARPVDPVRVGGVYPPPLAGSPAVPSASTPRVTRYDRARPARPRPARPFAARAWTATSVALAAAGVAAVVLLPVQPPGPVRLDVPLAATSNPLPAAAPQLLPASEPVRVRVPVLGVAAPVTGLGLRPDGTMELPPGAATVGWYVHGPTPGELGPAVVTGHVDWAGEDGAFSGLRALLPGDQVVVDRADGSVATFRVDRVEEHAKSAFPSEGVYGDIASAGLRLITCGGRFDARTGDYADNVIVFATLAATA